MLVELRLLYLMRMRIVYCVLVGAAPGATFSSILLQARMMRV